MTVPTAGGPEGQWTKEIPSIYSQAGHLTSLFAQDVGRQKPSINFNTESWAVAEDLVGWFMGGRSNNEGTGDTGGKQQALMKRSRTLNLSCHI